MSFENMKSSRSSWVRFEGTPQTGQMILPKGLRALTKNPGLGRVVTRTIEAVELIDPAGQSETLKAQTLQWDRIDRVVTKWVRGLYRKEYGERLPIAVTCEVAQLGADGVVDFVRPTRPSTASWPETFEYFHSRDDRDPTRSRWSFLVWGTITLVAATNEHLQIREDEFA